MDAVISLLLLLGGLVVVVYGAGGFRSTGPELLRQFWRPRAEQESWILLGGVVAIILGSVSLCRGIGWF